MNGPDNSPLAAPEFDAISVEVEVGKSGDPAGVARQALAVTLQALALGPPAATWAVRPVHASLPRTFDLLPPSGHTISVSQAFDMQYHLAGQEQVRRAEATFETLLDNMPETNTATAQPTGLESLSTPMAKLLQEEKTLDWSLKFMEVPAAWELSEPDKKYGRGIVIGHPDSGYLTHPDLTDARLLHDLERDFYETDDSALNPEERGGSHGLGTGSVIISNKVDPQDDQFVIGVAPQARLVPMRIVQKGPPLFFHRGGPRRVREAIFHAIDSGCHIISMSMGGIWFGGLEEALQMAYHKNILLIAAAGNVVRTVIWPAKYKEVIAVAGCTARRERWVNSSRGKSVDITAPGHNVWRACIVDATTNDPTDTPDIQPSSGTSYATALTAGVAALWLAHHGRDNLLAQYKGVPLNDVFRHMLRITADDPPAGHNGRWGVGILNARKLLAKTLPPKADIRIVSPRSGLESMAPQPTAPEFSEVFEEVPEAVLRDRLAATMGMPESEVKVRLSEVGPELLFHLVTNPTLRENIQRDVSPLEGMNEGITRQQLHDDLLTISGLSSRLRSTIDA